MLKIGLIVNPVAGIGGKVGLKGSDGEETLRRALCLGAKPESNNKAVVALRQLAPVKDKVHIYAFPGEMGADAAIDCGLPVTVLGDIEAGHTKPADTVRAAHALKEAGVDIVLFAGGDGTARNVLDAVGTSAPVLGIPAGCKIHSAVYALNPRRAGELIVRLGEGRVSRFREAEVMDIDEELFRQNRVQARLYGYMKVPEERSFVQNMKSGRGKSEAAATEQMANYVADMMQKDMLYIVGPGSTTRAVMDKLRLQNTLLGVDIVYNNEVITGDATENDIMSALEQYGAAKIIVTVIGGQGYVFGRGNQQLSARVIRSVGKENITIIASKDKMLSLIGQSLYVDTGDEETNAYLCGYYKVVVGYEDHAMFKVTC